MRALEARLPRFDPDGRFDFSQDAGTLTLSNGLGNITAHARFVPVGTWSSETGSWLWGWANESIDRALVAPLQKLRDYGAQTRIELLTSERVACSAEEAQEIYAVAVHLLQAQGWYRSQMTPTSVIHTALFDIRLAPAVKAPVS